VFIRKKYIKGKPYAYRVKNSWTRKGARQKVSSYLGRVYELKGKESDYNSGYRGLDAYSIICSLLEWVLLDHGFHCQGRRYINGSLSVSLGSCRVRSGKAKAVLYVNGDYMCDYTLRKLIRFTSDKDRMGAGKELAGAFISAGIPVPRDVFVHVFEKVYKEGQSFVK